MDSYIGARVPNIGWHFICFVRFKKCCSASTSVGAISAACFPFATDSDSNAAIATTVLPLPTSPCSSLAIGVPDPMSSRMVRSALIWS